MKLNEYIGDVQNSLMDTWGMSKDAAKKAVVNYNLKERIERCPLIASHDDPKSIAETIANDYATL